MPRVTARQVWITVVVAALAAPVYLSSGSAAFRPAWFADRFAGLPASVWLLLALIAILLVAVRVISAAVFDQQKDTDEGAAS